MWRWCSFTLFRNRFAIAAASLVWLIWRSGSQPRRLAYPCQQAAAANLGFLAVLFVPELVRRHARVARRWPSTVPAQPGAVGPHLQRAVGLATGSVALAGVPFLLVSAGITVHSDFQAQSLPDVPPPANPPPSAIVSIVRQPRLGTLYTQPEIDAMVEEAVWLAGGLDALMIDNDGDNVITVVLKPNLVDDRPFAQYPENGAVTDPRVMAAVVRQVKEAGIRAGKPTEVIIAEGSAGPFLWDAGYLGRDITRKAYVACGYDVNNDGWFDYDPTVALIDLNDAGAGGVFYSRTANPPFSSPVPDPNNPPPNVSHVTIDKAVMRRSHWVPDILLTCDLLISVPTLKNHGNADVTLSLKNRFGCPPSDIYHTRTISGHELQMKHALHFVNSGFPWDIDRGNLSYAYPAETSTENLIVNYTTVDLNLVRPQDLVVVDGLVGITNGPTGTAQASPNMQLVMAGRDSVAVDTVATLLMNYNPQYVSHLRWAYNRELGTMDPGVITVVGDHVAMVRQSFGTSHPPTGSVMAAELTPPAITGLSIIEGETLSGVTMVAGSGLSDNVGIVKAELAVYALGPDLLVNGGFEQGSTGWTQWSASWGTGYAWDYHSTEPGHAGNACLKLGTSGAIGSFGVFQEVAVEPGMTYRVDALWKGNRHGTWNWYEILLIDGPFSLEQADSGDDATVVRPNYMYAYDNNTWFPGGDFGWIWTHNQNAPPKGQVDYNNRQGRRQATASVMTVVLKAGACCGTTGVAAWFDEVSLRKSGPEEILLSNPNPPYAEFDWDTTTVADGDYEAKVTVYDAALNEASIRRNVTISGCEGPRICLQPARIDHNTFVCEPLFDDVLHVSNCGTGPLDFTIEVDQQWLNLNPSYGAPGGEPDPITISYLAHLLLPGTHTATITVADPLSCNSPRTVTVTVVVETVQADLDRDGDVDQTDLGLFQRCFSGPGQPYPAGCAAADMDQDGDVDQNDFAIFHGCMTGANTCALRGCEGG